MFSTKIYSLRYKMAYITIIPQEFLRSLTKVISYGTLQEDPYHPMAPRVIALCSLKYAILWLCLREYANFCNSGVSVSPGYISILKGKKRYI